MWSLSFSGLAFYVPVLLGAFAVRSAAGFGAGLVAIPMLAFILPVSTAVSVATVFTTLSSVQQVSREWRQIAWRQFAVIFLYSMVGVGLGLYFIKLLDEDILRHCLGVFLILYSLYALSAADTSRLLPRRWHGALGAGVGIVGGLCSALFGAGAGPIYVVYFDILRLEKAVFRATMSAVVLLGGAARIVGYESFWVLRALDHRPPGGRTTSGDSRLLAGRPTCEQAQRSIVLSIGSGLNAVQRHHSARAIASLSTKRAGSRCGFAAWRTCSPGANVNQLRPRDGARKLDGEALNLGREGRGEWVTDTGRLSFVERAIGPLWAGWLGGGGRGFD